MMAQARHLGAPRCCGVADPEPVEDLVPVFLSLVHLNDPDADDDLLFSERRTPVLDLGAHVDGGPVG